MRIYEGEDGGCAIFDPGEDSLKWTQDRMAETAEQLAELEDEPDDDHHRIPDGDSHR